MSTINWLIQGRRTGKTVRLIEIANNTDKIIVCHNEEQCKSIYETSKRMECKIKTPISYFRLLRDSPFNGKIQGIYLIDEIDDFLDYAFSGAIYAATLTPKG